MQHKQATKKLELSPYSALRDIQHAPVRRYIPGLLDGRHDFGECLRSFNATDVLGWLGKSLDMYNQLDHCIAFNSRMQTCRCNQCVTMFENIGPAAPRWSVLLESLECLLLVPLGMLRLPYMCPRIYGSHGAPRVLIEGGARGVQRGFDDANVCML